MSASCSRGPFSLEDGLFLDFRFRQLLTAFLTTTFAKVFYRRCQFIYRSRIPDHYCSQLKTTKGVPKAHGNHVPGLVQGICRGGSWAPFVTLPPILLAAEG